MACCSDHLQDLDAVASVVACTAHRRFRRRSTFPTGYTTTTPRNKWFVDSVDERNIRPNSVNPPSQQNLHFRNFIFMTPGFSAGKIDDACLVLLPRCPHLHSLYPLRPFRIVIAPQLVANERQHHDDLPEFCSLQFFQERRNLDRRCRIVCCRVSSHLWIN